jgi:hypothetical protein
MIVKNSTKTVNKTAQIMKQLSKKWNSVISLEESEHDKNKAFIKSKSRDDEIIMEGNQKKGCCRLNGCPIF